MTQVSNPSTVLYLIELAIKVQNKGICHVLVEYSGHVDMISLTIYEGDYNSLVGPVFRDLFTYATEIEKLNGLIKMLQSIIDNGIEAIPGYVSRKERELAKKKELFESLKSELGEAA